MLVALACTGTLAIHMFVPALPLAGMDLDAEPAEIQRAIGVYVLGLAFGQLVYGPISDALGRRPVVVAGVAVFVAGSLLCAFAPNLHFLLVGRLIQALGGAGGLTLARAIVRDIAGSGGSQKDISLLNLIMLIGPAISPVLGSWIAVGAGWRMIFLALGLAALLVLVAVVLRLPETARERRPLGFSPMIRDLGELAPNRRFFCIAAGGALGSTATYAYFAAAPYILVDQLGVAPINVGWFVGSILIGAVGGTWLSRVRDRWISQGTFLLLSGTLAVLSSAMFLLAVIAGLLSPLLVLALTLVMMFAGGCISPTALAASLDAVPERAGSAAGFFGAAQMTMGGICTLLVGLGPRQDLGCGLVLLAAAILSLALLRTGRVRDGQPRGCQPALVLSAFQNRRRHRRGCSGR